MYGSMRFLSQFSIAGATTVKAMALYDDMYGKSKRGELNFVQRARFRLIRISIEQRLQLVEVTPDFSNFDLHQQMAGKFEEGNFKGKYKDLVHSNGVENIDRLKELRLGGKDGNKTAYALIDPETRTVLAAIYVYRSEAPKIEGADPYDHVPGDVYKILNEPLKKNSSIPTSLVFFSISRFFKMSGEGELLISKLHQELSRQYKDHPEVIFSTLSPLRGLKKWCEEKYKQAESLDSSQKFNAALNFLIAGGKDVVKRFHLSNGAIVGAVRQNANSETSVDAKEGLGIMVNYIYDRNVSVLLRNAASFNMKKVIERLSETLLQHMSKSPSFSAFIPK